MPTNRREGDIQPGIKWGPFVIRIPFVHTRFALPEMLQGICVAGATGLALVPIMVASFGLTFEEAVTMAMFHSLLISCAWMLFGDPIGPGWITPALPFIFAFVLGTATTPVEQFQLMTALSLNFAALLFILGVTGFGAKLVAWVPNVLKGGIILGAAVAAFLRIFDQDDAASAINSTPIAAIAALALCMFMTFSKPFQRLAAQTPILAKIASLGLLPAFLVAGVIGVTTGEMTFNIQTGFLDVPAHAASMWQKASPLVIGWPSVSQFVAALPLAFITYILFFGDLVTAEEMIKNSQPMRKDEKLDISSNRAHMATGIRNGVMGIIAPFFGTQGVLWTGIQVIILKRWASGRDKMDSVFDGIAGYYVYGLPILFVVLPIVTLLQPLLPIALAVTLLLTGFACATLALTAVTDPTERGAMVLTAIAFSLFDPWTGLLAGMATILVVVGPHVFLKAKADDHTT
ncbi:xanthine permease [Gammaproteobacteria bacterium LSUCC0112]|nr:xanthine permease [Gammaproteobacteria bacterium LSUCC0112]